MNLVPRTLLLAALAAATLAACGQPDNPAAVAPLEITHGTSCALDGMLLADYPGPKAQIHYAGQAEPDFFCDTVEMFNLYLKPEQVRAVRGLFVQDMGKADWDQPRDHWIDAKTAYYVHGSKRHGSMGPTIASFAQQADAAKFATEHGGKVYRFADITPDMVVLDGGAQHDSNM
jgi:copper chaperone NosL